MGYGVRIDTLCSFLTEAKTFADVGCDHGYCSEYVLKKGLCDFVLFSDVSKGSLEKATVLLLKYVREGKAKGILGDGFFGVPKDTEEVLIAGMGGSEIVKILSDKKYGFLPEKFVFQPMLDGEKLRSYLLANGGYLERDFTFYAEEKPYDLIVGRKRKADESGQIYTRAQLAFGRENVENRPKEFSERLQRKTEDLDGYLSRNDLQEKSKRKLLAQREFIQGVLSGEIK